MPQASKAKARRGDMTKHGVSGGDHSRPAPSLRSGANQLQNRFLCLRESRKLLRGLFGFQLSSNSKDLLRGLQSEPQWWLTRGYLTT